jgi:hypothetical protein
LTTRGACSPAEYRRMVTEKAAALRQSAIAAMTGRGKKEANARRLRRRG